jgi:hypothetical protein
MCRGFKEETDFLPPPTRVTGQAKDAVNAKKSQRHLSKKQPFVALGQFRIKVTVR